MGEYTGMDPYLVLRIAPEASDEKVREAYLGLVRRYPPDLYPEMFQRISAAYEVLKDERSRLRFALFDAGTPGDSPFQAFLHYVAMSGKRTPPSYDVLKDFLRKCVKS